jgi:hypothetical protein
MTRESVDEEEKTIQTQPITKQLILSSSSSLHSLEITISQPLDETTANNDTPTPTHCCSTLVIDGSTMRWKRSQATHPQRRNREMDEERMALHEARRCQTLSQR